MTNKEEPRTLIFSYTCSRQGCGRRVRQRRYITEVVEKFLCSEDECDGELKLVRTKANLAKARRARRSSKLRLRKEMDSG